MKLRLEMESPGRAAACCSRCAVRLGFGGARALASSGFVVYIYMRARGMIIMLMSLEHVVYRTGHFPQSKQTRLMTQSHSLTAPLRLITAEGQFVFRSELTLLTLTHQNLD